MHKYRSHKCNEIKKSDAGKSVRLSGWVHRKRDHGGVLFVDLRDHYGITQLVFPEGGKINPADADKIRFESVITITGKVVERVVEAVNSRMDTGEVEVIVDEITIESAVEDEQLPVQVNTDKEFPENTRLKYRFLDLRREKIHNNIVLRSNVISEIRSFMTGQGFMEFQTPILTASSPEGARDFLVPSRMHPGKFYALPQAPQQFKQLLMISGFDRYFQIAPCFRDEDARADRSPGEFYQLDMEMSFVTQADVFAAVEPLMVRLFTKFGKGKKMAESAFPHITFDDAMLKYGSDKPDLRNPLIISDVTEVFRNSNFGIFAKQIELGSIVRAIPAPRTSSLGRSFFDKKNDMAKELGYAGLGYIIFDESGEAKGPIAKNLTPEQIESLKTISGVQSGDGLFFACGTKEKAPKQAGEFRKIIGEELKLLEKDCFKFCWITDFPYYEWDEEENKIIFSHNPFSMPQGGLEILEKAKTKEDLLAIKAYQYDIVCNGIELSSGAIRNHKPELMYKAFEIAGYTQDFVDDKFGGMIRAFKYGAPPHGGIAPGVDRMVMLLADEPNIREIIAFPLNQNAEDLLMNAPCFVDEKQLRELNIQLSPKAKDVISKAEKTV